MKEAKFIFVTPEMAKKWLQNNQKNRRKRGWWVEAIAAAIMRGEWITTHQGVAFDEDGVLIDGQHRLEAIVKSGVCIEMLIVTGLDRSAFGVIDNGIKRTIADLTEMPKRLSESSRLMASMTFGGTISPAQCVDVAKCGLGDVHEKLMERCGTTKAYYGSAPMRCAAVALVMDGRNEDYVFSTYANLVHEKFSDLPLVAQSLIRQVNSSKTKAGMSRDVFARGLKVFNPDNSTISKLQISDSDIESASAYGRSVIKRAMAATQ